MSVVPRQLSAKVSIVDFAFHPTSPLAILALVNGKVKIYDYGKETERMRRIICPIQTSNACRSLCFMPSSANQFFGGFESGDIIVGDLESGSIIQTIDSGDKDNSAIFVLKALSDKLVFSGDDTGCVKLTDIRISSGKPVVAFSNSFEDENDEVMECTDDWVSDIFICTDSGYKVLVTRSDGTLCHYSTRRGGKEILRSEPLGAELTAMVGPMKSSKKLIASGSDGALNIFNWEEYGNISDRFPLCKSGKMKSASGKFSVPVSVDSMCMLTDSLLFAGCGDGKIRLASVLPNAALATVGIHEYGYPVEHLRMTYDSSFVASSSYDGTVKFWSTAPYKKINLSSQVDSDDDSEGSDNSDEPRRAQPRLKKRKSKIRAKLSKRQNFYADLDKDFDDVDKSSEDASSNENSSDDDSDSSNG